MLAIELNSNTSCASAKRVESASLEKEKQYSQDLLSAQKQFIRYAIHETNTPLAVMMTNIELFEIAHGKGRHLAKIEAAIKKHENVAEVAVVGKPHELKGEEITQDISTLEDPSVVGKIEATIRSI